MSPKVVVVCKSYCSHPTERGAMELTAVEIDIIQHGIYAAILRKKGLFGYWSQYKEDASQEAWCRILKLLPTYDSKRARLIGWASMQADFAIRDWLRTSPFSSVHFPRSGDEDKKPTIVYDHTDNAEYYLPPIPDPTNTLIRLMDNTAALALLRRVKLPDSERRALDNIESFHSSKELGYFLGVTESRASQIVTSLCTRASKLLSCFHPES